MAGLRGDDNPTVVGYGRDSDETTLTRPQQVIPPPPKRRSPLAWVLFLGIGLLLCLVAVGGVSLYFVGIERLAGLAGGWKIGAIVTSTATATAATPETVAVTPTARATTPAPALATTTPEATRSAVEPGTPSAEAATPTAEPTSTAPKVATPAVEPVTPSAEAATPIAESTTAAPEIATPIAELPVREQSAASPTSVPTQAATELTARPSPTATETGETPEPTATETVEVPTPTATGAGEVEAPTSTPEPSPTTVGVQGPSIGPITFSAVTSQGGQPIRTPNDIFSGPITEVHAIFTYQNMVDGMPWERHWYLDGQEMAKGSASWDKGPVGSYHLTLAAGGRPLGDGNWKLEIYVGGEPAQEGEFVIMAPGPTVPRPAPTPTAVAIIPTGAPTTASTSLPQPTSTAPVVANAYTIAFSRWDGYKHDMFIARTDGSSEMFVLQRAAGPSWSPDGLYLAFCGEEGVDRQMRDGVEYQVQGISNGIIHLNIASWSADPSRIQLFQDVREGTARWAAWSPDGRMIAFDAQRGGDIWRTHIVDVSQSREVGDILGEQADWSPDSSRLVYRSGRDNRQGIWISNRDDTNPVAITSGGSDSFPRWSPDGRKIAFHRDSGDNNVDIYLMDVDGSNIRRLTDTPGPDTLPAWTPDGRIVFRSVRSGTWGIYIMDADGSNQKQIIGDADPGPDWAFGRMDVH
jgi:hypothetical protein